MYEFFKNHARRGVFGNVNSSNLENVLQRHVTTDKAGECIFQTSATKWRASHDGGTSVGSMYVPVCPNAFVYVTDDC